MRGGEYGVELVLLCVCVYIWSEEIRRWKELMLTRCMCYRDSDVD